MAKLGFRGLTYGYSIDGNQGIPYYNPIAITDYYYDNESLVSYEEGRPGVIVRRYIPIIYNDLDSSWTTIIRRNGIDTDNQITVPSSTTGHFYSDTQVTYNTGDKLTIQDFTVSSYDYSIWPIPVFMIASPKSVSIKYQTWFFTVAQNLTRYYSLIGISSATESIVQTNMLFAGKVHKYNIYVNANSLTGNSTYTSRRNGVDGNLSITVATGTSGLFEDTSAEDEFVAGDDLCIKQVNAAGGTSIQINIVCEVEDYTNKTLCKFGSTTGLSANRTRYVPIVGTTDPTTTESGIMMYMPTKVTFSNFQVVVSSNSVNGTSTFSLRVNQTDKININVVASTSGVFSDTSSTTIAQQQQNVSVKQVTGGTTGGMTLNIVNVSMDLGDYDLSSFRKDIKIRPRAFAPGIAR